MKSLIGLFLIIATTIHANEQKFTLSSTTSTQNSGLYDYILPIFTDQK